MEKNRKALWLLILSQLLILLGGLLDWPASLLMISLRVNLQAESALMPLSLETKGLLKNS